MLLVKNLSLLNGKKIDLELEENESYVLEGPNGSGKSVLLRTLSGLYPSTWDSFSFKGKRAEDFSPEEFRSKVLYVGSTTYFPGDMTVEEFLSAPFKLGVYKGRVAPPETTEKIKSWKLQGKKLSILSSGQKQLLVILRALSLDAELLLLDEPTSHMDREKTLETEKLLLEWKKTGRTFLVISHSEEEARRLGKRIQFEDLVRF